MNAVRIPESWTLKPQQSNRKSKIDQRPGAFVVHPFPSPTTEDLRPWAGPRFQDLNLGVRGPEVRCAQGPSPETDTVTESVSPRP